MSRYEQLKENMRSNIKSEASKIEGSFIMDNISVVATELARIMDTELISIVDDMFLDTASGNMLDKKALEFNEKRREARYASGEVVVSAKAGTIISKGVFLESDFGIFYESLEEVLIGEEEKANIKIKCLEIGSIGNLKGSRINKFKDSLNGVLSVVNESKISGGVDLESDESFRERIYEKIRKPIVSGNKNHYVYLAKQVAGVLKAKVLPLANGNGTLRLIVLSTDYDEVEGEVLENLRKHIEANRPIGADVEIVSAKRKNVSVDIKLSIDSDYDLDEVKAEIKEELAKYIRSISFNENKVLSFYKIGDIIFSASGVKDIISYKLNGSTSSLSTDFDEFFYLSEVIVSGS